MVQATRIERPEKQSNLHQSLACARRKAGPGSTSNQASSSFLSIRVCTCHWRVSCRVLEREERRLSLRIATKRTNDTQRHGKKLEEQQKKIMALTVSPGMPASAWLPQSSIVTQQNIKSHTAVWRRWWAGVGGGRQTRHSSSQFPLGVRA
jgi:hypothetical protein